MYVCFILMIKHMVFKHTYIERKRFAPSRKSRAKRVCFKTPLPVRVFDDSTQRTSINVMLFWNPQKLIHKDTILILVYIHTYPVFARRINIVKPKTYIHTQQRENAHRHRSFWSPKLRYPAWTKKCVQTLVSVSVLKHSGEPARNLIFWASGSLFKHGPPRVYVCMSETSKHVCMYVCMYVWSPQACMYASNIHT